MSIFSINPNSTEQKDISYTNQLDFKTNDSVYWHIPTNIPKYKYIVAFDLDWTLSYGTKSLYPSQSDDIEILPNRYEFLAKLIKRGYSLVIFTNQKSKSKKEAEKKVLRVQTFLDKIKLPIYTFISVKDDVNRKPTVGMFEMFKEIAKINPEKIFYIGDALGRPQDFSDTDLLFGKNISAIVLSPEEVFIPTSIPKFKEEKELVITVGASATGKTTYSKKYMPNHEWINQDILKTKKKVDEKVLSIMKTTNKSIVVDATHPTRSRREELYKLADKFNYKIRVLHFVRNGYSWNKLRGDDKISIIAYHTFYSRFENPNKDNVKVDLVWF